MKPMKKILLASLVAATASFAHAADKAAGEATFKKLACASCHGADGRTSADPMYPKIAGQHADYLEFALKEYKRGAQAPTSQSATIRKNAIMQGFATQLSDEDIKNVAAYLSSLPSELGTRK